MSSTPAQLELESLHCTYSVLEYHPKSKTATTTQSPAIAKASETAKHATSVRSLDQSSTRVRARVQTPGTASNFCGRTLAAAVAAVGRPPRNNEYVDLVERVGQNDRGGAGSHWCDPSGPCPRYRRADSSPLFFRIGAAMATRQWTRARQRCRVIGFVGSSRLFVRRSAPSWRDGCCCCWGRRRRVRHRRCCRCLEQLCKRWERNPARWWGWWVRTHGHCRRTNAGRGIFR